MEGSEGGDDGLAQWVQIGIVDAGHIDASAIDHVDAVVGSQAKYCVARQSREGEHAGLVPDEGKIRAGTSLFKRIDELVSDTEDAGPHGLEFLLPDRIQFRVVEDGVDEVTSVGGRIRIVRSDDDLQLAEDPVGFVLVFGDSV